MEVLIIIVNYYLTHFGFQGILSNVKTLRRSIDHISFTILKRCVLFKCNYFFLFNCVHTSLAHYYVLSEKIYSKCIYLYGHSNCRRVYKYILKIILKI